MFWVSLWNTVGVVGKCGPLWVYGLSVWNAVGFVSPRNIVGVVGEVCGML